MYPVSVINLTRNINMLSLLKRYVPRRSVLKKKLKDSRRTLLGTGRGERAQTINTIVFTVLGQSIERALPRCVTFVYIEN